MGVANGWELQEVRGQWWYVKPQQARGEFGEQRDLTHVRAKTADQMVPGEKIAQNDARGGAGSNTRTNKGIRRQEQNQGLDERLEETSPEKQGDAQAALGSQGSPSARASNIPTKRREQKCGGIRPGSPKLGISNNARSDRNQNTRGPRKKVTEGIGSGGMDQSGVEDEKSTLAQPSFDPHTSQGPQLAGHPQQAEKRGGSSSDSQLSDGFNTPQQQNALTWQEIGRAEREEKEEGERREGGLSEEEDKEEEWTVVGGHRRHRDPRGRGEKQGGNGVRDALMRGNRRERQGENRSNISSNNRNDYSSNSRRLPLAEMRGILGGRVGVAILCWGNHSTSRNSFGKRLQKACNSDEIFRKILKFERVFQKDGVVRFDVFCRTGSVDTVLALMRENSHRWGWYVRTHIVGRRVSKPGLGTQLTTAGSDTEQGIGKGDTRRDRTSKPKWLGVGTLNVNGVRSKGTEVRRLVEKSNIGILALQETRLKATDNELRIPGFQCISSCGESNIPGARGVALLVRDSLQVRSVGLDSPWAVFAKCWDGGLAQPWVVGCVYIPYGKKRGSAPVARVLQQLRRAISTNPGTPMVLMGDWNRTETEVGSLLRTVNKNAKVLEPKGAEGRSTYVRNRSGRKIDHIAVLADDGDWKIPKILFDVGVSDHYPVAGAVRCKIQDRGGTRGTIGKTEEGRPGMVRKPGIDTGSIPIVGGPDDRGGAGARVREQVATSNRWSPLLELASTDVGGMDPTELQSVCDATAEAWTRASLNVAKENGMTRVDASPQRGRPALRESIARAIDKKGEARAAAFREKVGTPECTKAWEEHRVRAMRVKEMVDKDQKRVVLKQMNQAAKHMRRDPRAFWKWLGREAGWKQQATKARVTQPMKHPVSGKLLTDEGDISAGWGLHYGRLAADVTGNSRRSSHWDRWRAKPQRQHLTMLDADIAEDEVVEALTRMKRHKAPGEDGVPADFLKLALGDESSDMRRGLLALLNLAWKSNTLPAAWKNSVVVSIPKKGDLTDMNNYRGISLMSTVLKILMGIISTRLNRVFETKGFFSPAQAGFRRIEECVTQTGCLLEVARRREIMGMETCLLFVDLKKAYDTVPQEALMAKLDHYGVRGRMLGFIGVLYAQSMITVRSGSRLSDPVRLERGVRQGCPLSPVLFNIFINDILDGTERMGVSVPGLGSDAKIPGLMFADDLVTLSADGESMKGMTDHISEWTTENEMAVGIQKCGVMAVGGKGPPLDGRATTWVINGETVPVVETYKYLGVDITPSLDLARMMKGRKDSTRKLLTTVRGFLRSKNIPMPMKMSVMRGVVMPRLLFGAEVYGMNMTITDRMQTLVNRALRKVVGLPAGACVSSVALWRETGVPPLAATTAGRRARAYQKSTKLQTWVRKLVDNPLRNRKRTWLSGTATWMDAYTHRLASFFPATAGIPKGVRKKGGWTKLSSKSANSIVRRLVWAREERRMGKGKTASRYKQARYAKHTLTGAKYAGWAELAVGLREVSRTRIGGIQTAAWLANRGVVAAKYKRCCPCCGKEVPETIAHILLRCPRWKRGRKEMLRPMIHEARGRTSGKATKRSRTQVALLLGGEYNGKQLKDWDSVPNRKKAETPPLSGEEAEPTVKDGVLESLLLDGRVMESGALRVAAFLQWMVGLRDPIIRAMRRCPPSTEDQRPNG